MRKITFPLSRPYDIPASFEGQTFRWSLDETGWWSGFIGNVPYRLRLLAGGSGSFSLKAASDGGLQEEMQRTVEHFLGLNRGIANIQARFADDPALSEVFVATAGLHMLRQEPWECLACFIISQNSNIQRIRKNVDSLTRMAGAPIHAWGQEAYAFPGPDAVARLGPQALRALGLGYRAEGLAASARMIAEGAVDLEAVRSAPYQEARAMLVTLPGVGPKVADCVLAYSLDHDEAFAVDTWVEKALRRLWLAEDTRMTREKMAEWGRGRFGPHAAYIQLALFQSERARALAQRDAKKTSTPTAPLRQRERSAAPRAATAPRTPAPLRRS